MYTTTYTITGNTYNNRQWLKENFAASWDADAKAWIVVGSLLYDSLAQMRACGLRISETPTR